MQCSTCHAISASRIPTPEALTEYYSGYYDSPDPRQAADERITFDKPRRLADHLADTYRCYSSNREAPISILDFGGGNGAISHLLAMRLIEKGAEQVDITVVDYNKETVCPQDGRVTINRAESLDVLKSPYSLVIASAVIEHHPRPRELLRHLLYLIEQGGVFYARTPCMLPIMNLLRLVGVKVDFTYPGHLHDLGQVFWEGLFTKERSDSFRILASRPSIVETSLGEHFLRTVAAYSLKAPWYLLGESYKFVGGWEIFSQKNSGEG